jgi:hypothetical protein
MDLIYKISGVLLAEEKGKDMPEWGPVWILQKILCETEICTCLIMKDVRKTVHKFSYNPNAILSTVLPVISVICHDTPITHG